MGIIYCITGKSAAGKDTLFRALLARRPDLTPVVPCTTRPMRDGEREGESYHFVTPEELARLEQAGEVLEKREYHTVQGLWTYFTRRFPLEPERAYLLVTTLDGVRSLADAYGADRVRAAYLDVDDAARFHRCVKRERRQARPDYPELCRRYLADQADFSEERLRAVPNLRRIDTGRTPEACLRAWEAIQWEDAGGTAESVETETKDGC